MGERKSGEGGLGASWRRSTRPLIVNGNSTKITKKNLETGSLLLCVSLILICHKTIKYSNYWSFDSNGGKKCIFVFSTMSEREGKMGAVIYVVCFTIIIIKLTFMLLSAQVCEVLCLLLFSMCFSAFLAFFLWFSYFFHHFLFDVCHARREYLLREEL